MRKTLNNSNKYFHEDKPLFGLDISSDMLKVMQLDIAHKMPKLVGYGSIKYDHSAIVNGVIVKPELLAKTAQNLFKEHLVGTISTDRVAVSLPASRTLTHTMQLPKLNPKDVTDAVEAEAIQYLPISPDELYIDHNVLREDKDGLEVFIVAVPRKIVDSYLTLTRMLGLDTVLVDTAISASSRIFALDERSNIPSVLVNLDAISTDVTVYYKGIVVTATVVLGGDDITAMIAGALKITPAEAGVLKNKYGLTASLVQKKVLSIVQSPLELVLREIRRSIRYYEQRYAKEPPIGQIVTMGAGASMPGLTEYLTSELRLPVRAIDLVQHIDFNHLKTFYRSDRMSYVTVAGLAVTSPTEIFR